MLDCVVFLPTDQARTAMTDQYITDKRKGSVPQAFGVTDSIDEYLLDVDACPHRDISQSGAVFSASAKCSHPERPSCGTRCPIPKIQARRTKLSPYVKGV